MLCQLSYCPWLEAHCSRAGDLYTRRMASTRRRSLGLLFALLAVGFVALTAYAAVAGVWVIAVAAGALAAWMAELAFRALR